MKNNFICLTAGNIGSMSLRNRIVYPAMETNYCNEDGTITNRFIEYHYARAKGGIGLIITEATMITPDGRSFPHQLGIYEDAQIPGLRKFTEKMHSAGAKTAVQLFSPGRQTAAHLIKSPPMAPSESTFNGVTSRAMTRNDIIGLINAYASASRRAVEAGFDAIELHGGNGYIFQQFHSRFTNRRTDEYGGSIGNRIRFTKEVIEAIRQEIGNDFPLILRLGVFEPVENGLNLYEGLTIARLLAQEKIDALHVTAGMREAGYLVTPPAAMPEGTLLHYAREVRQAIDKKIPVIGIGRILSLQMADKAIRAGDVDFVTMGRAFIADPLLIEKTLAGREDLIVPCVGCNEGCMGRLAESLDIACAINPAMGKEYILNNLQNDIAKKILVIGAGPAGCEAALQAKAAGHDVVIADEKNQAGGKLHVASLPPFKQKLANYAANLQSRLAEAKIEKVFGKKFSLKDILEIKPDVIILATGAEPADFALKGADVIFAEDALQMDVSKLPNSIAIIGGGMVGAECAEHLASCGKTVTLIELREGIALDIEARSRLLLLQRLKDLGVAQFIKTTVVSFDNGKLKVLTQNGETEISAGQIILATGYKKNDALKSELEKSGIKIIEVGDAKNPSTIMNAVHQGYEAGRAI